MTKNFRRKFAQSVSNTYGVLSLGAFTEIMHALGDDRNDAHVYGYAISRMIFVLVHAIWKMAARNDEQRGNVGPCK